MTTKKTRQEQTIDALRHTLHEIGVALGYDHDDVPVRTDLVEAVRRMKKNYDSVLSSEQRCAHEKTLKRIAEEVGYSPAMMPSPEELLLRISALQREVNTKRVDPVAEQLQARIVAALKALLL